MELWDILDERRNLTGRTVERGKPMRQDEYHLVVDVWIRNSKGEYLISKRTPNKIFPNMWEPTGGSAVLGDSSLDAALREVKEELGVELLPQRGECLLSFKRQHHDFPDFKDIWLFKQDILIEDIVFQPDEVCDAKWATQTEILSMIEAGDFIGHFTYLDVVFNS